MSTDAIGAKELMQVCEGFESSQWQPLDVLLDAQWKKLVALLEWSQSNIPFHESRFRAAGVDSGQIRSYDDFRRLPLMRRQDLVDAERNGLKLEKFHCASARTTGTSGPSVTLWRDPLYDARRTFPLWRRWMKAAGMKPRDRLVRLVSGQPASRVATLGRTIDIPLATSLSELLDSIAAARPNFLLGPPATLEYISLEMLERGLQLPPGLKLLLANGDNLTKAGRDLCRAAFGCEVVDHYASRECSSGIAWQCSEIDGYHVNVENVFLEVLNADGEVAAPGEVGRVVITDLSSQPVPLIRYEVGDLAAWQGRSCGCGRSLPCLASIDGRIIERMKLANGEWLTAHVLNTAFAKVPFPVQYQVREDAPGHITVDVVIPSKSDASNELNAIEAALGRTVLATVAWAVNRIDSIPGELFSKRRLFFPYEGDEARQHLRSAS